MRAGRSLPPGLGATESTCSPHRTGEGVSAHLAGSPDQGLILPAVLWSLNDDILYFQRALKFPRGMLFYIRSHPGRAHTLYERKPRFREDGFFVRGFVVNEVEWAYPLGLLIAGPVSPHTSQCGPSAFRTVCLRFRFSQQLIITLSSKTF